MMPTTRPHPLNIPVAAADKFVMGEDADAEDKFREGAAGAGEGLLKLRPMLLDIRDTFMFIFYCVVPLFAVAARATLKEKNICIGTRSTTCRRWKYTTIITDSP
jgi:hypothetical protein